MQCIAMDSVIINVLFIMYLSGTSDPYVKVRHKNYKNRTSTIYKNLNPIWNEEFGFKVRHLFDPIVLKVYDEDVLTSDDFMGRGIVPLNKGEMGR